MTSEEKKEIRELIKQISEEVEVYLQSDLIEEEAKVTTHGWGQTLEAANKSLAISGIRQKLASLDTTLRADIGRFLSRG